MRGEKTIFFAVLTLTLPVVFSKSCPHGIQPVIFMQFYPSAATTVGSDIQLYCNASTVGLGNRKERWELIIHDRSGKLISNATEGDTIDCALNIRNVTHADAKQYFCVAKLLDGCSVKNKNLIVKDCTSNKDDQFNADAVLTERMTVLCKWKYRLESCDRAFRVYWSNEGPVIANSSSTKIPRNITSYEIINLELNSRRKYWIGMAVETSKGLSRIYRVENSVGPICTSNKYGYFFVNASITEKNTISINWKYKVESCDEQFVVYWSSKGPILKSAQPQKFISDINITAYEIKALESRTQYWIGMAVNTTNGVSEIYAFNGTLITGVIGDSNPENHKANDQTTPVVILVILVVCLVGIGCTVFLVVRNRKRKSQDTVQVVQMTNGAAQNLDILYPERESPEIVDVPPLSPKILLDDVFEENEESAEIMETDAESGYLTVLDEWEVPRDQLSITSTSLGSGQFGIVKKATFHTRDEHGEDTDLLVAVKFLKDNAMEIDRSDLLTELRILKFVNTLPHPNILRLTGACTSEQPILVITEYCAKGNLKHLLKKYSEILNGTISAKSEPNLTNEQLLSIAVDIARGMEHLAAMKFVHRDLAARNVLVTESWVAKISDFGLARETSTEGEYIKNRRNLLPVKWTAIEALVEGKFTTASDVWSYGVLLWEISNIGGSPYKGISPHDIMSHVGSGGRLGKPDRCSPYLFSIMSECWETQPEKRPTFATLHQKLSAMLEEAETTYINVEFMSDGGIDNNGYFERYTPA